MADEKKVADPALVGFYEAIEKTNIEKIKNEILAICLNILKIVEALIWKVKTKMRKIGPGDQVTLSSENHPLSRVKLTL
jgi:hypothetical protein